MKVLIQWAKKDPKDWETYSSNEINKLIKKPEPKGGEKLDNRPGWVYSINIQGTITDGWDHYCIKDISGAVVIIGWNDDLEDYPEGFGYAGVRIIKHPAYDIKVGGINTCQWYTVYGQEGWMEKHSKDWIGVRTTRDIVRVKPWSEFEVPTPEETFHGIWLSDELAKQHEEVRQLHGWHEWIE